MFNRRRDDTGTTTTATSGATSQPPALFGRPVQNSIRPPVRITRQQHIDSYIHNPQLAPSTRKLSDGTCFKVHNLRIFFVYFD
jgi:hypothetical protein